ncbi:MAG TPA: signal peptidase I [Catenuloplanes sp.]|jgi:signal peptidase I
MHRSARQLVLITVAVLMTAAAAIIATGKVAVVVTQGVSMEPTYHQGDLVVAARAAEYRTGDIVAYHGDVPGVIVLHRIIGGDAGGFTFKGDNNQSMDPLKPAAAELIGRAVIHIPRGGIWLHRATSPPVLALFALGLLISGGTVVRSRRTVLNTRGRRKRATVARNSDRPRRTVPGPTAWSPPQRTAVGAIGAMGLLAAALGALAWTGPVEKPTAARPTPAPSMTFTYSAQVPRSAAYDGTVVSSPDPVFRRLARVVEVRFGYQGAPGSVTVTAELSTASGWHTSVPLATTPTTVGERYDGAVRLDLDALQARAVAAAEVIGVPAGQVDIAVTPRITTTGDAAVFAPALRLSLTPLQLTLVGPETLVVKGSPGSARSVLVPRTLGLRGQDIMTVATARTVSVYLAYLVLGALLAALAFIVATHRTTAAGEAAAIRRRYTSLLVRVDPMANPPGRPVVNVTDFRTLVRLAERYELLILHWSRNNAETFVVHDEGTTYRYHCDTTDSPAPVDEEDATAAGPHPARPA